MGRPTGDPAFEDLTARARIRDAAVRLFAEGGVDGTTVRDIAQAAGVSPGLLRHHFGSKESLREVCDLYVLDRLVRIKEELLLDGKMASPGFLPSVHPTILLFYRYVTRALLDGSPRAAAMFDDMVLLTEQWISKNTPDVTEDYRGYAAVLVGMQSGILAMHDHVSRALGVDIFTADGHLRMAGALADFYSHPLLDPKFVAQARQAMESLRATNPPTAAGTDPRDEGA
ncbi:TetR/AcrR family transcriptional regulator [Amorphoplanes digitatis]|uniref:AcrR family transcriptional regulator n=1 Tax=Actinoplanes digitatis TaxID=1868 RepID=A0A7W7HYC3_9ACTN|nr:helix-turn-helix domain-containing protein [Actinoplanes digitatis]MBB4762933.1 AcrR family transcriptional regulator [Actinoplanes digitatis]BFE71893.1 TetR/AcrR family transcriptional regulator [Actinoplanes digitatis]GID91573.1 TetR family transcriptional regulator [Actinoplanes digitatis]